MRIWVAFGGMTATWLKAGLCTRPCGRRSSIDVVMPTTLARNPVSSCPGSRLTLATCRRRSDGWRCWPSCRPDRASPLPRWLSAFAVSERTVRRDDDEEPSCVLSLGTDDLDWAARYLVYLNLDFDVLAPTELSMACRTSATGSVAGTRAELESQLDLDQLGVALHRPAPTGPHEAVADVGVIRRRVAGGHVDHQPAGPPLPRRRRHRVEQLFCATLATVPGVDVHGHDVDGPVGRGQAGRGAGQPSVGREGQEVQRVRGPLTPPLLGKASLEGMAGG